MWQGGLREGHMMGWNKDQTHESPPKKTRIATENIFTTFVLNDLTCYVPASKSFGLASGGAPMEYQEKQ